MICKARLSAQGQDDDLELASWSIKQEFEKVGIWLNDALPQVARWLTEKVNHKSLLYSPRLMAGIAECVETFGQVVEQGEQQPSLRAAAPRSARSRWWAAMPAAVTPACQFPKRLSTTGSDGTVPG